MQALQSMSVREGSSTWSAMLRKQLSSVSWKPKTKQKNRLQQEGGGCGGRLHIICIPCARFVCASAYSAWHICEQSSHTAVTQSLFKQTTELLFRACFITGVLGASGSRLDNTMTPYVIFSNSLYAVCALMTGTMCTAEAILAESKHKYENGLSMYLM